MPYSESILVVKGDQVLSKRNDDVHVSLVAMVGVNFLTPAKSLDRMAARGVHSFLHHGQCLDRLRLEGP